MVPKLGTRGYHCKQLPIPKGWNWCLPMWEPRLPQPGIASSKTLKLTVPNLGTRGYHCKELPACSERLELLVPNLRTMWVTLASNCRSRGDGTHASKPGNHRLPLQELPVPQGWNWRFATWEPKKLHQGKDLPVPRPETYRSQPGNHRLPLQATAGSQQLELMFPNLGTIGYHCKELPIPTGWNWWFPTWKPKVAMTRNYQFPDLETCGSQPGNQKLALQGIASSQKLEYIFQS